MRTDGVAVVVDKTSMQFVFGSEVDWVDGLQGAGFSVNNPNVEAACGCGSSFQVKEDDGREGRRGLARAELELALDLDRRALLRVRPELLLGRHRRPLRLLDAE